MTNGIIKVIHSLGFSDTASAVIALLVTIIAIMLGVFARNLMKFLKDQKASDDKRWQNMRTDMESFREELTEMKNNIRLNNEATTLSLYHQCFNEAKKWEEKGEIPIGAKMHFERVWHKYEELGDGQGNDPMEIVKGLNIVN